MSYGDTLDLVVRALGWALLHSIWQGALIAFVVAVLLSLRDRSAQQRYVVACVGLATMVAAWIGTAVVVNQTLAPAPPRLVMAQAPPVELGPAGPGDRTPAIRVIESPEALGRVAERRPMRQRMEAWSSAMVPLWLGGVVLLSARLGLAWLGVARLRRARALPVSEAVAQRVADLTARLQIGRAVRVVQSAAVQVPLVVGWLRPIVMLPASALTGLSPAQLESIIAHELAHVRRHDYLVNALQSVAEVLLYYHPACWWISRRIRVEREHCCDDVAVALCGDGVTYASALADLELHRRTAGFALAATDGPLLQRVRRVIAPASEHRPAGWAGSLAPIALLVVLVVGAQAAGRAAMAQPAQAPVPTVGRTVPAGEAVLQGRVVEANSARPVAGATIQAMGPGGAAETRTNDDGRYELAGLKPGSYTVAVRAKGFVQAYYGKSGATLMMDFGAQVNAAGGRITSGLDVRLESAGNISGRITDAKGAGIPGVEVELVREPGPGGIPGPAGGFAQTVEDGSYRMTDVSPGDYMVRAYTARGRAADGAEVVYAPTFYPGVADSGSAQRLRLYPGQELLDVDFALATSRLFVVAGRAVDAGGPPVDGLGVVIHPMEPSGLPGGEHKVTVDAKGAFEIRGVAPGRYMVNVMDPRRTMRWVSSMRMLTVDGDVRDLELRAELGATIEGHVVRDVGTTKILDLASVYVGFTTQVDGQVGGFTGSNFPAGGDGTFSLESPGGLTRFSVKRLPSGWAVKSVSLDGAELDDVPIDFGSGRRQVEIVLTDKVSTVSGIVVDRNGSPLSNYSVVLFPPTPSRWHRESRFLATARSDNAGQFRLDSVPPGTYLAVAVAALPMGSWQDPSVLQRLQSSAETIRLGEGQQLTISIRASPTPDGLATRQAGPEVALVIGCRSNQRHACGV